MTALRHPPPVTRRRPPQPTRTGIRDPWTLQGHPNGYRGIVYPSGGLGKAKNSASILFDWDPVVHLIDAEDLGFPAIAAEFVILAHDQGLNGLGGTHFRAQPAKAAARQVEVEVVQDLDLLARLAVAP